MSIVLAPNFTQRNYSWTGWKAVQFWKNLVTQFDDDGTIYTIYGYDGPEVHLCTIWKGAVPDGVVASYSQTQNDSDKSDFETNFKSLANSMIIPKATDGTPNHLPNIFPNGVRLYIPGIGDDRTLGFAKGVPFQHSSTDASATDHPVTWQFNDWIYLSGGQVTYEGAVLGDTIDFSAYAPATSVSSTPGTGNCNLVTVGGGGASIIVPAAGNGSSTVDLTAAIPVPNLAGTGFWDWNAASSGLGLGTITANGAQKGGYDLYNFQLSLGRFVPLCPMLGSHQIDLLVPAVIPKKILPQWMFQVVVHNCGGSHLLQVIWNLIGARIKIS